MKAIVVSCVTAIVRLAAVSAGLGLGLQAHAAGGHHFVDDAALLEPGQCAVESWFEREKGGRRLLHAGPACRVGPVELGLSVEHDRTPGAGGSRKSAGAELKWVYPLGETLATGVVVSTGWQNTAPRFAGSSVLIPLTWQAGSTLLVHLNLGRDFPRQGPDSFRGGVALEWSPVASWSLVAERFREGDAGAWRAGARYTLDSGLSIDVSRARGVSGGAPGWWTVGVAWVFDR
ncbi:MAG: hypothetical protein EOO25_10110 [Comamonadaceae bacterium]|nr:MAG: hypothetical protein EOO25_10110 [Comamonadaceae bacterium]